MIERLVLAGSDFSRGSEAAVRLAVAWTRSQGGTLSLVHALEGPAADLADAERARILEELGRVARRAGASDLATSARVELVVAPAEAVLAPAADRIVVVGAEGGSATLLRRCGHVPSQLVATLPAGALALVASPGWRAAGVRRHRSEARRRDPGSAFERVLVACSLRGADAPRIELACRIASASPRSEIHLAHVIDVSAARHLPPGARGVVRETTDAQRASADQALRDLAADVVPLDLAARRDARVHVVRQGPADRDLAGLAVSQAIDLMVAGPGEVTRRLAGLVPCPLLVAG